MAAAALNSSKFLLAHPHHQPVLRSSLPSSFFILTCHHHHHAHTMLSCFKTLAPLHITTTTTTTTTTTSRSRRRRRASSKLFSAGAISATLSQEQPLDLTEDNVRRVLEDARTKFAQIFDVSAGMTGEAELAELDGPFVKIRLRGRFWHERSMVLARLGTYLQQRIPEILEVDIEDKKQLDDSPENF